MFSLALTSFLIVLHWSCAQGDEVTHMPDVEELTLAPQIVEVMQNAEVLSPGYCLDVMQGQLQSAMRRLDSGIRGASQWKDGLRLTGLPVEGLTPCSQCRIVNQDFQSIKVEKLIVYRYLKDSHILDAYLRLLQIHLQCNTCVLTDDGGNQHSGDFDIIWTKPLINILVEDVYESSGSQGDWVKFLKFNGTNVNRDTVHVTCIGGDETFKEVCKSSDESGELDRVMHAASERLFKFEEKDFAAGNISKDQYKDFTDEINQGFHCAEE